MSNDLGGLGAAATAILAGIGVVGSAARTHIKVRDHEEDIRELFACKDDTVDRLARIETKLDLLLATRGT